MKRLCQLFLTGTMVFGQVASTPNDSIWTDTATGLTWTGSDSGAPVTFIQANYYCSHLELGSNRGWRLPTIDELQALFGGPANANGFHVKGPLKLTGWEWSSTLGKERGEAWALDFGDGGKASIVMGDSGLNRALCVLKQ